MNSSLFGVSIGAFTLMLALISAPAHAQSREVWVLTENSRQLVSIDAESEQVFGSPIELGGSGSPMAPPFDVVFARVGGPSVSRYAFVVQGRFIRVVDVVVRSVISTVDVGALLPVPLTLQTLRGASAGPSRVYLDSQGNPEPRASLLVAADVSTAVGVRPYFVALDQQALISGNQASMLVDHGALLGFVAQAMQAEVLGMPEGTAFERAWFTVRELSTPPKLHLVLIAAPDSLPRNWTVRRVRTVPLPASASIPLGLNIAAPYGTPPSMAYEPTSGAGASLSGRLVNVDLGLSCPPMTDGLAIDVTGVGPSNVVAASIGSPAGSSAPGELRITELRDCSSITRTVGRDPSDVLLLDEERWRKVFVSNRADNSVSVFRSDGGLATIPLASIAPSALALRTTLGSSCAPVVTLDVEDVVDADGDGSTDDVSLTWTTVGCPIGTVFRLWCRCTSGDCPSECPDWSLGVLSDGVGGDTAGGEWGEIGTTTGHSYTHINGGAAASTTEWAVTYVP